MKTMFRFLGVVISYRYVDGQGKNREGYYANLYNPLTWAFIVAAAVINGVIEIGRFVGEVVTEAARDRTMAKNAQKEKPSQGVNPG